MRRHLAGAAPMVIGAGFLSVLGSLFLLLALTSTTSVQWTGRSVPGTEQGGIVFYSIKGQSYSLDDTSSILSRTVYFDPRHPATTAMLGNPVDRALDILSVGAPYTLAGAIIGVGTTRRLQRRRERNTFRFDQGAPYGQGLDPELVQRLLAEQRRRPT